jgi:hypothetical protein
MAALKLPHLAGIRDSNISQWSFTSLIVIEKMKKSETLDFEEQDVNSMPTSILCIWQSQSRYYQSQFTYFAWIHFPMKKSSAR